MKRIFALAILILCAVTGVITLFTHSSAPPQLVAPRITVAEQPPRQEQARTAAPSAPTPVVPAQPETAQPALPEPPPVPVVPSTPATPEVAAPEPPEPPEQPTIDLSGLPAPLPPRRPRPPISDEPQPELSLSQMAKGSPIFIRIFKRENVLELWTRHEGRYRFVKKYPICAWSGALGPKQIVGDSQAPEGFYAVTKKQLNPNSAYHRAFNIGYPNAFDAQLGRTGSALMVHGACASVGCYAMTNTAIAEIYPIVEAALNGGQKAIPVHIFPFRMTVKALKAQETSPWYSFWTDLKTGYDRFEKARTPPTAFACKGRYVLDEKEAAKRGCQKITGWL